MQILPACDIENTLNSVIVPYLYLATSSPIVVVPSTGPPSFNLKLTLVLLRPSTLPYPWQVMSSSLYGSQTPQALPFLYAIG